jgi:hypothetical protein
MSYGYLKSEGVMVVGVSKVSVVQEPDIADIEDLVIWASEEMMEVLGGLQ